MHVFKAKKDLINFLENERIKGKKIGFVPTMGALHPGHLELIKNALRENDLCVCSIFVNPTQFNNKEDLEKYPRSIETDIQNLRIQGCQVAFLPDVQVLYDDPADPKTTLNFGDIETILEGKHRPGHFRGVGLVVAKLFNIVRPHRAYFGQKDLQQYFLIKQLIHDLSFNIQLKCVPTLREKDGLAFSSRNRRIAPENRAVANKFYECLLECKSQLERGEDPQKIRSFAETYLSRFHALRLEYIELVDTKNFCIIHRISDKNHTALCIAGYINNIRLIDNVFFN